MNKVEELWYADWGVELDEQMCNLDDDSIQG